MARASGTTGVVSIGADVSGVTKWSLTYEADILDTTGMDSAGVASYIGGITRWSGSITAHENGELTSFAAPGTEVAVSLLTHAAGVTYSGFAIIKSIAPEVSVDGLVDYTLDFQGTGALGIA